jgi:hypothetical protein
MRMATAATALGVTLVLAAGLAACVPEDPVETPGPGPSQSPVFASEEEALAAAEDAYRQYLEIADQIAADGGQDPTRIESYASGDLAESALEGFGQLREKHWHTVGSTVLNAFVEQTVDLVGSPIVIAYVCVDVSGVDVLDEGGSSVVSADRPDQQAFEVTFEAIDHSVVPDTREPWTGGGVCA